MSISASSGGSAGLLRASAKEAVTTGVAGLAIRHIGSDDAVLELGESVSLPLADVVGAAADGPTLRVFEYRSPKGGCCGNSAGERVRTVHEVSLSPSDAEVWAERITRAAQGIPATSPLTRSILVIINPASGPGHGVALFDRIAAPILSDAGCTLEIVVTERAKEARDLLAGMPLTRLATLDAIVTAGGDGSFHDALQGLFARTDARAVLSRLVLGVLPTGSGNGAAVSHCATAGLPYNISNSTLLIARRVVSRMDVASVFLAGAGGTNGDGGYGARVPRLLPHQTASLPPGFWGHERLFAFLAVSFGVVADLDIESESLRCLGASRFDVYGVIRGCALRKYPGRLLWLPAPSPGDDTSEAAAHWPPAGVARDTADISSGGAPRVRYLPPFSAPPPASWRALDGPFSLIWVTLTSHQSVGVSAVRSAAHDDGLFTIAVMRDVSRTRMLSALLAFDERGSFATAAGVEVLTARAFRLEPDMTHPLAKKGHLVVDGENVMFGAIQAEVHPSLVHVYAPPATDGTAAPVQDSTTAVDGNWA